MMKNVAPLAALLALVYVCEGATFGQLCQGNVFNTPRSSDIFGQGHYGAPRSGRTHQGLDITCEDGSEVYAPFDLTINRELIVYKGSSKAAINKGLEIHGADLCVKLFYVDPDKTSGQVSKGQRLGIMMPMQSVYPGITSHVHVQLCNANDPTRYF